MSNKAQITQRASRDKVPATTVERDYVLAQVIAGLASIENPHGLVFKGGTALRLCFFEEYRYSADLDFSVVEGTLEDAYAVLQAALEATEGDIESLHLTNDDPIKIAYQGPLGRERKLKLDIAVDELVLNTGPVGLIDRWDDVPNNNTLMAYTLPEIAGEKLRCIMQRLQCRDLYDLSILFDYAQVDPFDAANIFVPKAKHRNLDPDRFGSVYQARIEQYRKRWVNELNEHVPADVPHFDQLERSVARHLRKAGLS